MTDQIVGVIVLVVTDDDIATLGGLAFESGWHSGGSMQGGFAGGRRQGHFFHAIA